MKEAFLMIGLILLGANAAMSCVIDIRKHSADFREAKAVFVGRVIEVDLNDGGDADELASAPYKIRFAVEKSWKGKAREITVVSDNGEPACGSFRFNPGEKYLVYAFGERPFASAMVGSRSRPLDREDDIRKRELSELNSFWFRLKANLWRL